MIDSLIRFSVKNKFAVVMLIIGLTAWGLYSMQKIPLGAVPDITTNQVQVVTYNPSLAPKEVEQFLTFPLELVLADVPGKTEIRSISRLGLSVITVVFEDGFDIIRARQLVAEQLKRAESDIPPGMGSPELMPVTTGLGEIYQYLILPDSGYKDKYSPTELRSIQDWIVKRRLSGIPGVAETGSFGGFVKQYEVSVKPERLRSFGLTVSDVFAVLEKNNANTGGSYLEKNGRAFFIRAEGLVKNREDIGNILIKNTDQGSPVLVRDVAEVRFGTAPRYGAMSADGTGEAVGGIVLMLKGANASEVLKSVRERVADLQKTLPEGLRIVPYLDRGELVSRTVNTVAKNLTEGGLIVIFVLVLLLGNVRAGLVAASVIPFSLLFAFGMMNIFGVSANLMSLGAIDFGLVVDGAVIITEAVVHHVQRLYAGRKISTEEMDESVISVSIRMRRSAAFGEIIIMIVYLPILALTGIEGKMFGPMAQTVAFAILGAVLLSVTYVPMMTAAFLSKKISAEPNFSDRLIGFFFRLYEPALTLALKFKALLVTGVLAVFFVAVFLLSRLGGEFIPTLEEGDLAFQMVVPAGSSVNESVRVSLLAEKILLDKFPEIKQVVAKIGTAEIPTDPMGPEDADVMVVLKDKSEWVSAESSEELADKMKDELSSLAGVNFEFSQPIQLRFNELISGAKTDAAIKIFGEDPEELARLAEKAERLISPIPGAADVRAERTEGLPQITVNYDRAKVARFGLDINDLNLNVRAAFAGETAGTVYEGERRFDLVVRLGKESRSDIEQLRNLPLSMPNGEQIMLKEVAGVEFAEGPVMISHENTKRRLTVGVNVRGRDVESLIEEIQDVLEAKLDLPPGYYLEYGGQIENLRAAKKRLSLAVPAALFLVFALLYFTFGSFRRSLLIFTAVPLSAIGGVFALVLRGMPFSISAGVGFIALFGVAVLNGIVLIGRFDHEGLEEPDPVKRVWAGTKVRFRPVLMTAAVAALGFLPMALSGDAGAEVQRPLATVVIGGLISATFLTLLVLPVLYILSETFSPGVKLNRSSLVVILFLGLFFLPENPVSAQENQPKDLKSLMQSALVNHPDLRAAAMEVRAARTEKKGAFVLPKTQFNYSYGQMNATRLDNAFNAGQNFGSPLAWSPARKLADSRIVLAEKSEELQKIAVLKEVKALSVQIYLQKKQADLWQNMDSIYQKAAQIERIRHEAGASLLNNRLAAESMAERFALERKGIETELHLLNKRLALICGLPADFKIPEIDLPEPKIGTEQAAELLPEMRFLEAQSFDFQQNIKLQKAQNGPEVSLNYTNQQIEGVFPLQTVSVGLAIPLGTGGRKAKIRAQEIRAEALDEKRKFRQAEIENLLSGLTLRLEFLGRKDTFYRTTALPRAETLLQTALLSLQTGQTDFAFYAAAVREAAEVRRAYLENLADLHLTFLEKETLTGDLLVNFEESK